MKRKIISMLMAMVILFTSVDLSVFASEINEVQNVVEDEADDVKKETTVSGNDAGQEEEGAIEDKMATNITMKDSDKGMVMVSDNDADFESVANVYSEGRGVWDGTIADSFAGGDGSEDNPYQIETAMQLAKVTEKHSDDMHYVLIGDIFLNDIESEEWYTEDNINIWTSIDNFNGTFDGQGHSIYGLYGGSLFGRASGIIQNICIENSFVFSGYESYVGAIAGYASRISGCSNRGIVQANGTDTIVYAGGIAGYADVIIQCYNAGDVYASGSNTVGAGGIVGCSGEEISDCYNIGYVNAKSSKGASGYTGYAYAGGIVGSTYVTSTKINNCYDANMYVSSTYYYCGGIVGLTFNSDAPSLTNCYCLASRLVGRRASTFYGNYSAVSCNTLTEDEMKQKTSFEGFDFVNIWTISSKINEGYPAFCWEISEDDEEESEVINPNLWLIMGTDTSDLSYSNNDGYNTELFNLDVSTIYMGIDSSATSYENVNLTVELPEGLSFSQDSDEKSVINILGTIDSTNNRRDMSYPVYITGERITNKFTVTATLTAEGYETPQIHTYEIPVSIIIETPDETIIDTVERYTSDKELKEVLDIYNKSKSDEEIRDRLFEYYNYDNMLDVRERLIALSDMHDERWDYEGLIRDDMYLSWQYYDYLNHTAKGAAARVALYASGLVFNGEINEWIDPATYMDSELPGIKKYKSLLEKFIQKESTEIEYYSYVKETEKFINSSVGIWSATEKAEVIKALKEASDTTACKSIFNNFIASSFVDKEGDSIIFLVNQDKPAFMEGLGIVDDFFDVVNPSVDAMMALADVSSNLKAYEVYHGFLQEIYTADDLPWELVVAAYQLDQEMASGYLTPIKIILKELRDACLDEVFDMGEFIKLVDQNGWLAAVNFSAFCINQFVDIGALVVNSCHTEGYAFLAMHYKYKLEQCKERFLDNKTEENAWAFYETYIMLWKLRTAGEEKFLDMSNLEGGKVVDGLSEAATEGTIAGLLSDLCGYKDKEAAVNDNLEMLKGFAFRHSMKYQNMLNDKKYSQKVVVECPVSVEILTSDGTQVCVLNDGVETEITNEYGTFVSFYRATTGDYAKIAYLNSDVAYIVKAIGQDSGEVTYSNAKTEDHLTCTIEGFDNVIISENDIIHITTDDEKYTIDKEGDGTTDIEGEQADKNKTFVQFDYQDGKQIQVKYVNENGLVTIPETPVRDDYEFKGWFTEPAGMGEEFTEATTVNRSMTVYAKWESKEILPLPISNIASGSVVEKGTEIRLSCATEGVQIYYTLDETNPTTDSMLYTEAIILTESATIKAIAVKEGYNNSEVAVFTYIIAEGETVTFTVTFNSNGGNEVPTQTVEENQKAKEPEEPTRKGYLFKGWYLRDKLYDFETPVTADITLEARWEIDESKKQGEVLPEDIPDDGIIPNGIWSAGIADKTYTGSAIKQSLRVYDGTKRLKEKTDYTISYKNNKNAYAYLDEDYAAFEENFKNTGKKVKTGTFDPAKAPRVTIKMRGNYSGSKTVYFKIEQADISGEGFEATELTVTYTGKKQTPKPTLIWNGKKLKYGTDFYVPEYDNAKNDKKAFTEPQSEPYKLTVTGKKNFTGEIPITLTISNSKKQIALNKVTVKGITNQKWNGEQITQSGFKVSYGKDVLTEENGDYTISWGANRAVGTGTVTFTGTGQDTDDDGFSYIGTKTVTFKISGTAMSKVTVTGVEKSYPFTGTAIKPIASLSYKANKNVEPIPLTEGTHYTVDYQKNVDKGTATIVFTGMESGGYTGTKKYTFKITAAGVNDITDGNVVTEQIQVTFKDTENVQDGVYIAPHMKGGAKPEVIVTSGGMTLELNKDYTISYANNKKPALSTDKKAPSLTVKGKGNFTGSKKIYFTIVPTALTNENGIKVVVNDKIVSNKPNGYRQNFKIYDSDGKALGSADYDAGKAVYTLIKTRNEDGTVKEENRILDKKSTVPANSTIRITVPGKGNYAGGEAYATYRILENSHDISKATIQIQNQDYTGNPVLITEQSQFKPGKVYIKIGKETKVLILGEDIQVVPGSYVKHVDKGTAKVTFRGINDFGGTKTVSYKIGARSIEEFWKGIQARMAGMFD